MAYCETCGSTYNQESRNKQNVVDEAKKYAKENKVEVGIYKEGNEWKYGTIQYLQNQHIPFREVVSEHS